MKCWLLIGILLGLAVVNTSLEAQTRSRTWTGEDENFTFTIREAGWELGSDEIRLIVAVNRKNLINPPADALELALRYKDANGDTWVDRRTVKAWNVQLSRFPLAVETFHAPMPVKLVSLVVVPVVWKPVKESALHEPTRY